MICKKCGADVSDKFSNCPKCGFMFDKKQDDFNPQANAQINPAFVNNQNQQAQSRPQGSVPQPPTSTQKSSLSKGGLIAIIIGGVVLTLLVIGVIAAVLINSSHNAPVQDADSTQISQTEEESTSLNSVDATEQEHIDYSEIESFLADNAFGFVGAYMDFRSDGKNIYSFDDFYAPSAVFRFSKSNGKKTSIKSIPSNETDMVKFVYLYDNGYMYSDFDVDNFETTNYYLFDFNGNRIKPDINGYYLEFSGKNIYYSDDDQDIKCYNIENHNTKVVLSMSDMSTSYGDDAYVRDIFAVNNRTFALLGVGDEMLALVSVDDKQEIIESDSFCFSGYYIDGTDLYYNKGDSVYKMNLLDEEYKSQKIADVKADSIYFVIGDRLYYEVMTSDSEADICYCDLTNGQIEVVASGEFPMDGI